MFEPVLFSPPLVVLTKPIRIHTFLNIVRMISVLVVVHDY